MTDIERLSFSLKNVNAENQLFDGLTEGWHSIKVFIRFL